MINEVAPKFSQTLPLLLHTLNLVNSQRTYISTTSLSNVDQVQYPLCSMRSRVMCLVVRMYYVVKKMAAWSNMF